MDHFLFTAPFIKKIAENFGDYVSKPRESCRESIMLDSQDELEALRLENAQMKEYILLMLSLLQEKMQADGGEDAK